MAAAQATRPATPPGRKKLFLAARVLKPGGGGGLDPAEDLRQQPERLAPGRDRSGQLDATARGLPLGLIGLCVDAQPGRQVGATLNYKFGGAAE